MLKAFGNACVQHRVNDGLKSGKSLMQCKLQIHHDIVVYRQRNGPNERATSQLSGLVSERVGVRSFVADKYPGVLYDAGIFNLRLLLCVRGPRTARCVFVCNQVDFSRLQIFYLHRVK